MNESVAMLVKELESNQAFLKHIQNISTDDDMAEMFPHFRKKSRSPTIRRDSLTKRESLVKRNSLLSKPTLN